MDPDITNTLDPRMKWAICLGLTGNLQDSYTFLLPEPFNLEGDDFNVDYICKVILDLLK